MFEILQSNTIRIEEMIQQLRDKRSCSGTFSQEVTSGGFGAGGAVGMVGVLDP